MPEVKCRLCLRSFYAKPNHIRLGWGKFCSIDCRSKAQLKGKLVNCAICDKSIYRSPRMISHSRSGKHFCSKSCQTLWRNTIYVGEKSTNWINGENAYRKILIRRGKRSICAICRTTDQRVLNAHHKDHQRDNNKIDNLIWLCLNCHYLVHHDKKLDDKVKNLKS